jgi:NADPH:quinone reductase-like Zn-dependent oxidoreductase
MSTTTGRHAGPGVLQRPRPARGEAMKAIVQDRYGTADDLVLADIDRPGAGSGEALIQVHAASVFIGDWHVVTGLPYAIRPKLGLRRPKARVRGQEMAGRVAAIGEGATQFQPGDEVFGTCEGAFAEYVSAPEKLLAPKPTNLTFEQAATVPITGTSALQALRDKGGVKPGQKVLIIGAAGGVGSFAVQIAKALGTHVTGVCSTTQADVVRSLGADDVIDYTQDDFTQMGRRWDLIVETAGASPISDLRRALVPQGTLVIVGGEGGGRWVGKAGRMVQAPMMSRFVSQKLSTLAVKHNGADLLLLRDLIEAGNVTPVIGKTYQLSEVPDAIRDLDQRRTRGKSVVAVREGP